MNMHDQFMGMNTTAIPNLFAAIPVSCYVFYYLLRSPQVEHTQH